MFDWVQLCQCQKFVIDLPVSLINKKHGLTKKVEFVFSFFVAVGNFQIKTICPKRIMVLCCIVNFEQL